MTRLFIEPQDVKKPAIVQQRVFRIACGMKRFIN
jgi:hypothetical protein